ncbi:aldo/keto reductase [Pseudarthrobacter sulfonivorans]|uniref:aldo/keto reductase n=1 Tax=Pseudarthrobacter sulfonivorans TaxID=121292 RepID=UPI002787F622|nr:aldo/keto reductase [Pseudarthrobacter sulfonivorans]MDQ0000612.1 aryl-alcohol dehydrogenase-like predicted oxidoreductase [Pseudarthrobacter sulfonivorans]
MTHSRIALGTSDLSVFPLNLGGNVFGWTADRQASFDILDAFTAGGGNFVDTADGYSAWVPGNTGGESERLIGDWHQLRGNRDELVIATKVSEHPDYKGLSATNVASAAEASLKRLRTDHIDLYYAHFDDTSVPLEETVTALSSLVDAGKVRYIGISNYSAARIAEWFRIVDAKGLHRPVALQPHYNLIERDYEGELRNIALQERLAVLPYYSLASGFLTGKYREGASIDSPRADGAQDYLEKHAALLPVLDEVAGSHGVSVATVSLAWLRSQPTIVAPIASARTVEQLPDLLASAALELSAEELTALSDASLATPATV